MPERKLAALALANKMLSFACSIARIIWARQAQVPGNRLRSAGRPGEGMMSRGEAYRRQPVAAWAARLPGAWADMAIGRTDEAKAGQMTVFEPRPVSRKPT
jgi:hypothetical protein